MSEYILAQSYYLHIIYLIFAQCAPHLVALNLYCPT